MINRIPSPSASDVFDMLLAVTAWHESIANQYQDGEMSQEVYDHECSMQLQRLMSYASCVNSTNDTNLSEFWNRHRSFAEWGFIKPRYEGYEFLA